MNKRTKPTKGIVKITLELDRVTHGRLSTWAKRENRSRRKQAALVVAREAAEAVPDAQLQTA